MDDETTKPTVDTVDDLNITETDVQDEQKGKKTKEQNFDGTVKKLNATQKELKEYKKLLEDMKSQKNNEGKDEISLLREEIELIKSSNETERLNIYIEKANINPKYASIAKNVVSDFMKNDGLDLASATAKVVEDYPEFANPKRSVGVPTGTTNAQTSPVSTKVLDGDGSAYFSLSPEQKIELRKKMMSSDTQ